MVRARILLQEALRRRKANTLLLLLCGTHLAAQDILTKLADKTDTCEGFVLSKCTGCLVVAVNLRELLVLVFLGCRLLQIRIAVPLVDIHCNEIPCADIKADTLLRKHCHATAVLTLLQNSEVTKTLTEITSVLMERCAEVAIERHT